MQAQSVHPLVDQLLADPEGEHPLADLRRLASQNPPEGATLMEILAEATADADPHRACRWLTVAAALWSDAAGDAKRAARALRAAIDVCPTDEDALVQLTRLYRDNGKHRPLVRLLERRAESLLDEAGHDGGHPQTPAAIPASLARAAEAFTALGHLLRDPPLESPTEAIAAYNRAIATGAATIETFRAARDLYLEAEQSADALPLFALEREHCEDPDQLAALYREEASARKLAGDGAGATAVLRLACKAAPDAPGLAEELWQSISDRAGAGETVLPEERAEAWEILAGAAARMEAKALPARDLAGLKLAFELAARALSGAPRAAELVRQAEVLVGLGAERPLALRHAEPALAGLSLAEAAPLLQRLEAIAGPDEAVELYQRAVERAQSPESRAQAVEATTRVAVKRGGAERIQQFFETVALHCADEISLSALERAAGEADKARGGTAIRGPPRRRAGGGRARRRRRREGPGRAPPPRGPHRAPRSRRRRAGLRVAGRRRLRPPRGRPGRRARSSPGARRGAEAGAAARDRVALPARAAPPPHPEHAAAPAGAAAAQGAGPRDPRARGFPLPPRPWPGRLRSSLRRPRRLPLLRRPRCRASAPRLRLRRLPRPRRRRRACAPRLRPRRLRRRRLLLHRPRRASAPRLRPRLPRLPRRLRPRRPRRASAPRLRPRLPRRRRLLLLHRPRRACGPRLRLRRSRRLRLRPSCDRRPLPLRAWRAPTG